jgi:hypothetical protein
VCTVCVCVLEDLQLLSYDHKPNQHQHSHINGTNQTILITTTILLLYQPFHFPYVIHMLLYSQTIIRFLVISIIVGGMTSPGGVIYKPEYFIITTTTASPDIFC